MMLLKQRIRLGLLGIFLVMVGCMHPPRMVEQPAQSMGAPVIEAISDAVYEVVVPKPTTDSLSYEKPLPLDLLPYDIRTDKYYSIGTAFAIDATKFVSAAHVMNIGTRSQFKDIFLRDKEGKIYSIDKVIKYSTNRDFIVFTLRDAKAKSALIVDTHPRINQKVYAVGNALGQGIVMRDGLYTSDTSEQEAGEWKWIRFSAAASPGNSGGPLIDQNGRVIGIVRGKSPNENLNYAVPMSEVEKASTDNATIQMKVIYVLDNMDMTKIDTLKKEVSLPKGYAELNNEVNGVLDQFHNRLLQDLLSENRNSIFPNGEGSTRILNSSYSAVFPHLIMKDKDGNWEAFHPKTRNEADLGNNGRLIYGYLGPTLFMHLQKPDDIPLKDIYTDSKLFMDLVLKSGDYHRQVGPEKVKITSMGSAFEDYQLRDSYGRIWLVRTWLIEYSDTKIVTFSLPVPGGFVTMMRMDQTGNVDSGHLLDLKVFMDFIYVSYYGTFKDWKEFLSMKELLPSIFSTINIRIEDNKIFQYTSDRFSISYGPDVMNISEKEAFTIFFSYFKENDKTLWDVSGISVGEDKYNNNIGAIYRKMKPPKKLGNDEEREWEDIRAQNFPFNHSAYSKEGRTKISKLYDNHTGASSILYTVHFSGPGNIEQKEMATKLDGFSKNFVVYENAKNTATGQ